MIGEKALKTAYSKIKYVGNCIGKTNQRGIKNLMKPIFINL